MYIASIWYEFHKLRFDIADIWQFFAYFLIHFLLFFIVVVIWLLFLWANKIIYFVEHNRKYLTAVCGLYTHTHTYIDMSYTECLYSLVCICVCVNVDTILYMVFLCPHRLTHSEDWWISIASINLLVHIWNGNLCSPYVLPISLPLYHHRIVIHFGPVSPLGTRIYHIFDRFLVHNIPSHGRIYNVPLCYWRELVDAG